MHRKKVIQTGKYIYIHLPFKIKRKKLKIYVNKK